MACSEKQLLANRRNALLSTGPRTAEGKARSRRNALKHGLSGSGTCLPEALEHELEAEYHALAEELRPQTLLERRLVEQAAIGSLRFLHAQSQMQAMARRRTRRALRTWDRRRERRVDAALRRLGTDPAGALARLSAMAEGCDALHDEWDALKRALESEGRWDSAQTERALRLLGEPGLPRMAEGSRPAALYLFALATREAPDPRLLARFLGDPAADADRLPPADEARAALRELAESEMARLAAEADRLWETQDKRERQSAVEESLLDLGPEFAKLHRYQRDGAGLMNRSLRALTAHRKEMARVAKGGGLPPPLVVRVPPGPPRENEAIWTAPMPEVFRPKADLGQDVMNGNPADLPGEDRATIRSDRPAGMASAPDGTARPGAGGPAPGEHMQDC